MITDFHFERSDSVCSQPFTVLSSHSCEKSCSRRSANVYLILFIAICLFAFGLIYELVYKGEAMLRNPQRLRFFICYCYRSSAFICLCCIYTKKV